MFSRRLSQTSNVTEKLEDATVDGWLQKRGQVNTALQPRYFLLNGTCLTYFDSEAAVKKGKANGQATVAAVGHYEAADAPELHASGEVHPDPKEHRHLGHPAFLCCTTRFICVQHPLRFVSTRWRRINGSSWSPRASMLRWGGYVHSQQRFPSRNTLRSAK